MAWPKGVSRRPEMTEKGLQTRVQNMRAIYPKEQEFEGGIVQWNTLQRKQYCGKVRYVVQIFCKDCNQFRWNSLDNMKKKITQKKFTGRCNQCSITREGENSRNWKGGRRLHPRGYIMLSILSTHLFASMRTKRNEIAEHRLIMAEHLKRPLKTREHVHHINGNKSDNRIENLELVNSHTHLLITVLENKVDYLEGLLRENKISF